MNSAPSRYQGKAAAVSGSRERPEIVATGIGKMAELIIEAAQAVQIPTEKNPKLVDTLVGTQSDALNLAVQRIPDEGIALLAEVCAWLFENEERAVR